MLGPCDICGEPATHSVADTKQIFPIKDKDGKWWNRQEIDGAVRTRCDAHKTEQKKTLLPQAEIDAYKKANGGI
jgi:hypothetical protein